eukprot:SAG31_NODE_12533_length_934_cov_1.305389_2_plen_235_part_00
MVVKGDVKVTSNQYPKFNAKSWVDGAFFGELPLLGLGTGALCSLHIYSVQAMVETELSFLTKPAVRRIERDYPIFSVQIRHMATKRAKRFGLNLSRSRIEIDRTRRKSLDLGNGETHESTQRVLPLPKTEGDLAEAQRWLGRIAEPIGELQQQLESFESGLTSKINSIRSQGERLAAFLTDNGVGHHVTSFEKHGFQSVDDVVSCQLTEEDFSEIGLAPAEAESIVAACAKLVG